MAFIKKFYLHPKFWSWSLLKLFSIYAHSSIEVSLKKSSWNSLHTWPTEPTPRLDAHRAVDMQFSTTSTKFLFPAERSLLKLRSKQTRETNNFSVFFWGEFFSSNRKSTHISLLLVGWRVLCPTWFKSANCIAGLTTLVGRFLWQVCYVWPVERSSPKRFAECCHEENF